MRTVLIETMTHQRIYLYTRYQMMSCAFIVKIPQKFNCCTTLIMNILYHFIESCRRNIHNGLFRISMRANFYQTISTNKCLSVKMVFAAGILRSVADEGEQTVDS